MYLSGCQAFERFTLAQILKINNNNNNIIKNTERISLVRLVP